MKPILILTALMAVGLLGACGITQPAQPSATEPVLMTAEVTEETAAPTQTPATQPDNTAFFDETKAYLLTGQQELPQAGSLLWTERFLGAADFSGQYQSYLAAGGSAGDVAAFAAYMTENAVAPEAWKTLFEQDLLADYGQKPESYEDLGDGVYQVYVKMDDQSVPFVTVNSKTGWYHG